MKKIINYSLLTLLSLSSSFVYAEQDESWVGDFAVQITRATTEACREGGRDIFSLNPCEIITLGQYAYTMTYVASLCVNVYVPGVTEYYRTDIPNYIKVEGLFNSNEDESRNVEAKYIRHNGNNAIYEIKLRDMGFYYSQETSRLETMSKINIVRNDGSVVSKNFDIQIKHVKD